MVTRTGGRTASVQRLVGVGCKRERGHVPIHHQQMEEKAAVDWDPKLPAENAAITSVKVRYKLLSFIELFIYLSIYLSIYLFIYLFINVFIFARLFVCNYFAI